MFLYRAHPPPPLRLAAFLGIREPSADAWGTLHGNGECGRCAARLTGHSRPPRPLRSPLLSAALAMVRGRGGGGGGWTTSSTRRRFDLKLVPRPAVDHCDADPVGGACLSSHSRAVTVGGRSKETGAVRPLNPHGKGSDGCRRWTLGRAAVPHPGGPPPSIGRRGGAASGSHVVSVAASGAHPESPRDESGLRGTAGCPSSSRRPFGARYAGAQVVASAQAEPPTPKHRRLSWGWRGAIGV